MIAKALGTRTQAEVYNHVRVIVKQIRKRPHAVDPELITLIKTKPTLPPKCKWTDQENQRFIEALREHGKDYDKIAEAIGTKTRESVHNRVYYLKTRI